MKNTIRVERARQKITQSKLADDIGCSLLTIHNIETGKKEPKLTLALKIVRFFGLKIDDVFKECE